MKNINLLPPAVEAVKKTRRAKIYMVAVQVAVFLCIGAVFLLLRYEEQRMVARSHALAERIAAFDDEPMLLVAELEQAHAMSRFYDALILENFPTAFDSLWVAGALEALPANVQLLQLSYSASGLVLLGEVRDIEDAYAYRQNLVDLQLFQDVALERLSLLENGMFNYEIRILVSPYE